MVQVYRSTTRQEPIIGSGVSIDTRLVFSEKLSAIGDIRIISIISVFECEALGPIRRDAGFQHDIAHAETFTHESVTFDVIENHAKA